MKEFIDKLIERLEEVHEMNDKSKKSAYEEEDWKKFDLLSGRNQGINIAISIIKQLAEEYKGGWIPCSERLPVWFDNVLVCTKDGGRTIAHLTHFPVEWKDMHNCKIENVIAWCELPAPYTEGE